ncbi:TetR/AcrR family transcriptional regulator [Sphingomonas solaris]|uniref:TetR/AcrR family transcriptional regulator n=1 Tax=Alterirhizorhabdus solaris TaxID=2529389 RepID=UPI0023B0B5E5|nr:TetR/AcrR family transcriptional regulator [Sphingomonas solaris]
MLTTARRLFGTDGFHATGTTDIVAEAKVTRGALYHHFRNKEELFEIVHRAVTLEISEEAQAATAAMTGHTLQRAMATLRVYLDLLATRRDIQRILLIDGPVVLGWERWRALRSEFAYAGWVQTLSLLAEQGRIVAVPIEPMAQIILAAVDEAALAVAHADDPAKTLEDMARALTLLIGGLVDTRHAPGPA